MPKRAPPKTPVKLTFPTEMLPMIDRAVKEGLFSGRNEFIMYLVRSHVDKMEERDKSKRDYEVYAAKTRKPKQKKQDEADTDE